MSLLIYSHKNSMPFINDCNNLKSAHLNIFKIQRETTTIRVNLF